MAQCLINASFWEIHNSTALQCSSSDCENISFENAAQLRDGIGGSPLDLPSIPVISMAFFVIGAIELFHRVRNDKGKLLHKNIQDGLSTTLTLYFQVVAQLLLAIVFPACWYIPFHKCSSHLMWSIVQLLFWTVLILLTFKDRDLLKSGSRWNWAGWRISIFCLANGAERLGWLYNSQSNTYFKLILLVLESLTAVVVIGLDWKIKSYLRVTEKEASTASTTKLKTNESEKPPRSMLVRIRLLLPYMWPASQATIQLRVVFCFAVIIIGRITNVYLPMNNKKIVDSLTPSQTGNVVRDFRWDLIVLYALLQFSEQCILKPMHEILWLTVDQFISREAQVKLFEHLLNLSLRFHINRKTGEVLRVMDRGISGITNVLNYLLFEIVPKFADIIIGTVFLMTTFDVRFTMITLITIVVYLVTITSANNWRVQLRKKMNKSDDVFRSIGVDSLLNYETVKYYNAEEYESARYREALVKSQKTDWLWMASYWAINGIERFIIRGGLLAGSLLCAYLISKDEDGLTVGDYVLFGSYMSQLTGPLNHLQYVFRYIQKAAIDMDKMFDIMEENPEVRDNPDAVDFHCSTGKIEFKNVSFSFSPEQPILSNLNFVVEPGKTLAIVGPSGAGKSTVIRLLFRFYDIDSGQILFDDQDVTKVKQKSLRRHMGVVPQDTVLFNDSIRFNIRYGRIDATDEEVEAAAKAAEIHDSIFGFNEGYETKVGERGLKLSGGEKQRVAIARTLLKSPTFVFLDEATSALDTQTERNIQTSLQQVCTGRTTVVIAHRLSTIISADEIIVLRKGGIAERGTHKDLLEMNGLYHEMWMQQLSPEKSAYADISDAE